MDRYLILYPVFFCVCPHWSGFNLCFIDLYSLGCVFKLWPAKELGVFSLCILFKHVYCYYYSLGSNGFLNC